MCVRDSGAPLVRPFGISVCAHSPRRFRSNACLREHAVTLTEVDGEAFADAARLAHRVGVALETTLKPARCYVAALGTAEDGVPMTFRHLHFNVIPVPEIDARPRQVLTWAHGIYDGDPSEWDEICTSLRRALR